MRHTFLFTIFSSLLLTLLLPAVAMAEITESPLRQRMRVPANADASGMSWTPRDARLRDVYIKLFRSNAVNPIALRNAFEYYEKNNCATQSSRLSWGRQPAAQSCCQNMDPNTMAIVDYTKPATENRLNLINLRTGTVMQMKVSHGANSGPAGGVPTQFSNDSGSLQSPAGFLLARGTYMGSNGLSMYLHGLENRNSNCLNRAIVAHGASYVAGGGRSHGCLAVEPSNIRTLTDLLQNGALVYNFNGEPQVAQDQNLRACSSNTEIAEPQ